MSDRNNREQSGRALVAIFDGRQLKQITAGENVTVSLAADVVKGGTPDKLWVTTTARVLK